MNSTLHIPLARIALKPYFNGIPLGSIGAIAKGYIPEKWKPKLKIKNPPRARVSVNTKNMQSAFDSLAPKISSDQMAELTNLFLAELNRIGYKNPPQI